MLSGERKTEQRLGIAAEICDHCLGITRHLVVAEVVIGYLYLLPLWRRELDRYAQCEICGSRSLRPAVFPRVKPTRSGQAGEIHQLIAETNPGLKHAAGELLDLWERLGSTAARQEYVGRHFLAAQERGCEARLARGRHWAFATSAAAAALTFFFCWGGNLVAALALAPAILALPTAVLAGEHWRMRRTLVRRCQQLLSGPATRWPLLEQLLAAQPARYPHLQRIWPSLRRLVPANPAASSPPRGTTPHLLALAQVLDES